MVRRSVAEKRWSSETEAGTMGSMSHGEDVRSWSTAEGAVARAVHRPDGAWLLRLPAEDPDAWPALVEAATRDGCGAADVEMH